MVERDDKAIFPPFEDYKAQVGDVLMDAAMRKALAETLTNNQDALIGSRVFHCFYIPNGQSGPGFLLGPASNNQTLCLGFSDSRLAATAPAEPALTKM